MERYRTEHLRHHGQLGREGSDYLARLPTFPRRSLIKLGALWGAAVAVAAIAGHLSDFVLYWVVPLLWCRYAFFYWSEIADHANTRSGTRSRLNPVLNWFEHNRGYHLAHHRYPSVPWFNLPAAHRLMEPGDPADSSAAPWETWRQLARDGLKPA